MPMLMICKSFIVKKNAVSQSNYVIISWQKDQDCT